MKAIEHHLYVRNRYYYYRAALPRDIKRVLPYKEVRVSLGTQDLAYARLYVARLDLELRQVVTDLYSILEKAQEPYDVDTACAVLTEGIDKAKVKAGLPVTKTLTNTGILTSRASTGPSLFSQIAEEYLKDCVTNAPKTLEHKRITFEIFQSVFGDLHFSRIGKAEARKFKTIMLKTPMNLKKKLGFESYSEVDWQNLPEGKAQSLVTVNNRLIPLISLFAWAEKNDLYRDKNPFAGMTIKDAKRFADKRHPFTKNELQILFTGPIYTGCKGERGKERLEKGALILKDYQYWIPLIGLFTGMRLNEICQLTKGDIREVEGIWIIYIDDNEFKKLKTSSSRRKIPIHNRLIELGLLDYVRSLSTKRLFPELPEGKSGTYSHKFTKQFTRILSSLELKKKGLCFHSFRHTFIDGLRNAGVEKHIAMRLVGHHSANDIHSGYGYGYNLNTLKANLNKLQFLED